MEKRVIEEKLLEIIEEEMPQLQGSQVDMTASFVEEYDVDSVSLIKMIVSAEQVFQVKVDDREHALKKYESFEDVVEMIADKL